MGVVSQLGLGLAKTREGLLGSLRRLLPGSRKLTPELCEALEGALLAADVGVAAATALMDAVRDLVRQSGEADADSVRAVLKKVMIDQLRTDGKAETILNAPHVILLAGVNGVGKTTVAGKLAGLYGRQGKRVALVDTAGRLHTKSNLMDELRKVKRTLGKAMPGAPHDVWLILDATVGQNGLAQARQFHEALGVTGVILTKLDGTAKGGIVLAVAGELGLPVRYIGVGEGVEDLQAFEPEAFVDALLGES